MMPSSSTFRSQGDDDILGALIGTSTSPSSSISPHPFQGSISSSSSIINDADNHREPSSPSPLNLKNHQKRHEKHKKKNVKPTDDHSDCQFPIHTISFQNSSSIFEWSSLSASKIDDDGADPNYVEVRKVIPPP